VLARIFLEHAFKELNEEVTKCNQPIGDLSAKVKHSITENSLWFRITYCCRRFFEWEKNSPIRFPTPLPTEIFVVVFEKENDPWFGML
jgi:hypothetical protein